MLLPRLHTGNTTDNPNIKNDQRQDSQPEQQPCQQAPVTTLASTATIAIATIAYNRIGDKNIVSRIGPAGSFANNRFRQALRALRLAGLHEEARLSHQFC